MSDVSDFIRSDVPPSGPGCVDCESLGSWWLHLRRCAFCAVSYTHLTLPTIYSV